MPYRDFQVNEILTAANVNTYLMDQTIMTFADATARDAALTSPSEGMFAYLSGTNLLTFYDGAAWQEFTSGGGGVTVSATAPASPSDGDLWWDSTNGELYLYYNDGTSSQWVAAAGPSVTVQSTAPTGYEGQLWLDDTDGSMYVYYTDPGGGSSSWIGAVSRSGGILQVVSTTKTDAFSTSSASLVDITGLSVTITPSSASSKVFVMSNFQIGVASSNVVNLVLNRNGSAISVSSSGDTSLIHASSSSDATHAKISFLDSPASTSSVTYQIQMSMNGATGYVNRRGIAATPVGTCTITAIEVAG